MQKLNGAVLDRLYETIESRRGANPKKSYSAKLLLRGPEQAAKKLGEEAVETALAGVSGGKDALAAESADLLYHLLVLWVSRDLEPAAVWRALEARTGQSGLAEKAARKKK